MTSRVNSFRVKLKEKLKFFLFQIKQVGQMVISKIITICATIERQLKKIKFNIDVRRAAHDIKYGVLLLPLPCLVPVTHQMQEQTQTPVEHLMPNPYVRLDDGIQGRIKMDETEVVDPVYPQLAAFGGDLFGQGRRMRGGGGGDYLESLKELQKLAFRPTYSELIRDGLNNGSVSTAIKFIVDHNLFIVHHVTANFAARVFNNPDYEIFQCFSYSGFNLLLNGIPGLVRYYNFRMQFPGAEAFVPQNPQHPQLGGKLNDHQVSLYMGKPKTTMAELYQMANKPADPLAGKMKVQDKFMKHKRLANESLDTIRNPRDKRNATTLLEQYRTGNLNPGIGSRKIHGTADLYELRAIHGARVAYRRNGDIIEVWAIFNKNNQEIVLPILQKLRPVK